MQNKPKYVYYANDMTKAYDATTVDYVERGVLATYTNNETFPMVMFIYDHIATDNASFQKTFLLQCVNRPTINGTTVSFDNGKGKLVLNSLKGADSIRSYGGDQIFYLPEANKTLNPTYATSTGDMWGRVEIRPNVGSKTNYLMNVIYVTDVETTEVLTPTLVETSTLIGAVALDQTAVFMKTKTYESSTVTFAATTYGSVKMNYYVGGLATGTWDVSIGGVSVGSFAVDNTTHFVTFASNATGTVTMTRR